MTVRRAAGSRLGARRRRATLASAVAAVVLALALPARGHDSVAHQLEELTARIAGDPSAKLYLRRGELYRLQKDWGAALADYARAGALDPTLDAVALARGRTLLEAGRAKSALAALGSFLAKHPEHGQAQLARARCLRRVKDHLGAARAYTCALRLLKDPRPGHYLERAAALRAAGARHLPAAILGLDEGLRALGPVVTLQLCAVEFELRLGRHRAALRRVDAILARARRPARWLVKRGQILDRAGRAGEARDAFSRALAALESLPLRHRRVAATRELEAQIRARLSQKATAARSRSLRAAALAETSK